MSMSNESSVALIGRADHLQSSLRYADVVLLPMEHEPGEDTTGLAAVIGGNVHQLRKQQGLSLETLARRSHVSRAMLSQIERGRSTPTIAVLWKIAYALEAPISAFLSEGREEENRITVSRSLTAEKHSVKLSTLVAALFYDLSPRKKVRVPSRTEDRERELQEWVKKSKRPVALFIDDAHALKDDTLTGLKRLMEVIESDGGCLSVVLAGWPKLRNDLRRPKLEEIGMRTDTFSLDGITGSQRE